MSILRFREEIPALKRKRNGLPPIYFDNACMTLKPDNVVEAINDYYTKFPACGGRSHHWFTREVDMRVTESREKIAHFIGSDNPSEIVFTRNTTEAINLVGHSFDFKRGDTVLTTDKEHNSNLCIWKDLEELKGIKHRFVPSNEDNTFNLNRLEEILKEEKGNVKLLSMVHTSNLDGYTIPAKEIIDLAHRYGALVLLDGAQSVPHKPIDVRALNVDFLAFSIHKMMGPSGIGVLYGKYDLLKSLGRYNVGGDTISDTFLDRKPVYLPPPMKFEAGLQDYAGMISSGAACDFIERIGKEEIDKHEIELNKYITNKLKKHEEIYIVGPDDPEERSGICTFFIKKPTRLSGKEKMLDERLSDEFNIMIRSGEFCVNGWFNQKLKEEKINRIWFPAFRASFYLYNTKEEIDVFVGAIERELERLKEVPIF